MSKLKWAKGSCGIFLLWATAAVALPAQTFTRLYSFCSQGGSNCTDGSAPEAGLVQGPDGNFYGTTLAGGPGGCAGGCGTDFKITPRGTLKTLHTFAGITDGSVPLAGLVQGTDGNFYGTTYSGGASNACPFGVFIGCGTVFKITPGGTLSTLHTFDLTDGANPNAGLVQATDGSFYGTTVDGGNTGGECAPHGCGTIFKITPSGTLTTLYNFCSLSNCADGLKPEVALVQGTDGNFYGTTTKGGANTTCTPFGGCGTVFEITPRGTLTTLHSFAFTDGTNPVGALVQATDGDFYGITSHGGTSSACFPLGCGTVFKITPGGALTTLYSFKSTDGAQPLAGLVQATDGNFYGTTHLGGPYGGGTVFKIAPGGALTTLYSFCVQILCRDGDVPTAVLVQSTDGNFYSTTRSGGVGNIGTVFRLSVGLRQFVETQPTSGAVGAAVNILGTNLTPAINVTFNGIAATFTVVSHSLITTTVPVGATTGTVQVANPTGTVSSNVPFTVN